MNAVLVMIGVVFIVPAVIGGTVLLLCKRRPDPGAATRTPAAGGAWGTGKAADRRSMWARRYGAGAAWSAAAWTAGEGLAFPPDEDGVGDPHATGGGAGPIGGGLGCGAGGCGGGGCGGGGCGGS